jgi:PPOX class probable F420-dependent enzyme
VDPTTAREFIRANHRAVLATTRADGHPQLSPVLATVDTEGFVVVSTRETAIKVRNLRRHAHATLAVFSERFYGEWVQIEGEAQLVSLPDALDGLVEYYRSISGEHPAWDDYRQAMLRERRVLVRIPIERAGPSVAG